RADVVAVAEVDDLEPCEATEALPDGHHVGECLTRMRTVGEAVDDGDRRVRRELLDVGLRERADHDRVEVTGEHDRGVLDRLAAAELEIARREVETRPAELVDPDLEGDAGPGRGLLEDHPERAAGEEPGLLAGALLPRQVVGEVEHLEQLLGAPVRDPGERPALQQGPRSYAAAILAPRTATSSSAAGRSTTGAVLRPSKLISRSPATRSPQSADSTAGRDA